jgi:hypothetical protein
MAESTDATFTERYFYDEICNFRELFQSEDWWQLSEDKRDKCVSGLAFIYLNINNADGSKPTEDQLETWAMILSATLSEYDRRKFFRLGVDLFHEIL